MNATNKGVAIAGGRVIRGTQDGFLYALDAKTGAVLWVRQIVDLEHRRRYRAPRPSCGTTSSSSAKPAATGAFSGGMMAFKAKDGSPAWRFDLTPTGGETGADTWEQAWHRPAWRRRGLGDLRARPGDRHACSSRSAIPDRTTTTGCGPGANLFTNLSRSRSTRGPAS